MNLVAIPEPVFLAVFCAVFLLIIAMVFVQREFDRLLRERDPELRDRLMLEDGDGRLSRDLLRFLWKREYEELGDQELSRAAGRLRALLIPIVAGFTVLMLGGGYNTYCDQAAGPEAAQRPLNNAQLMEERRNTALRLHNQGKVEEAIRIYDELLGPVGADGELVYWRGVAHWKAGREDMALVDFRRVMDLNPGWLDAYLHADRILSKQRRFDDCVDLWNRYLRVAPGDATAHMERGGSHYHRGDFAAAHADATRACELGKKEACAMAERVKATL